MAQFNFHLIVWQQLLFGKQRSKLLIVLFKTQTAVRRVLGLQGQKRGLQELYKTIKYVNTDNMLENPTGCTLERENI